MSVVGGTDAITDGLVVYLDSTNTKSFKGEATVNYVNTPLNWVNWVITANVIRSEEYLTREGYSGKVLKFNADGAASTVYAYQIIPVVGITSVTFSFWARKISGAGTTLLLDPDGYRASGVRQSPDVTPATYAFTIDSEWKKYSTVINTNDALGESIYMYFYHSSYRTINYEIALPQLEIKPYATPFVNGTRGSSVETGGGWANLVSTINNAVVYGVSGVGNVISLDGVDDYIEIPNATSLVQGQSQFTMGLWCKLDVVNLNLRGLIGTGNYSCTSNLIMTANNSNLTFYNDTTTCASVSWGTSLVANKWIFAVARFDGTNSVVGGSIDGGVLSYNSAVLKTGVTNTFSSNFRIMSPAHEYRTSGDVGIAFVYNRYLSNAELQQIFKFTKYKFGF